MEKRLIVAVPTPFEPDGTIDIRAFNGHLDFLAQSGVTTILILGTTGEFSSLTDEERRAVVRFARERWKEELLVNVSHTAAPTVEYLARSAERTGANGIVVLPPYYFHDGVAARTIEFLQRALASTSLPGYLYNYPTYTGVTISPEMLVKLEETCPQLVGIKDSGGNLAETLELKKAAPRIQVYTGSDAQAAQGFIAGLDGWVSGASSAVPDLAVAALHNPAAFTPLLKWRELLSQAGPADISGIKLAISLRVFDYAPTVRPPLAECDPALRPAMAEFFHSLPR